MKAYGVPKVIGTSSGLDSNSKVLEAGKGPAPSADSSNPKYYGSSGGNGNNGGSNGGGGGGQGPSGGGSGSYSGHPSRHYVAKK